MKHLVQRSMAGPACFLLGIAAVPFAWAVATWCGADPIAIGQELGSLIRDLAAGGMGWIL